MSIFRAASERNLSQHSKNINITQLLEVCKFSVGSMQKITNFVLAEINFAMHHVIAITPDTEFALWTATINLWSEPAIGGTKIFEENSNRNLPSFNYVVAILKILFYSNIWLIMKYDCFKKWHFTWIWGIKCVALKLIVKISLPL